MNSFQITKEEVKPLLFTEDMILYIKKFREIKQILGLINLAGLQDTRYLQKNKIALLYAGSEKNEKF